MGASIGSGDKWRSHGRWVGGLQRPQNITDSRRVFDTYSENPMVCKDRKTAPICSIAAHVAAHVYYKPMRQHRFAALLLMYTTFFVWSPRADHRVAAT